MTTASFALQTTSYGTRVTHCTISIVSTILPSSPFTTSIFHCLLIPKFLILRITSELPVYQPYEFHAFTVLTIRLVVWLGTRSHNHYTIINAILNQASAYEACDRTHTPKTLEVQKKAWLVWFKKLQGVRQIARLKQRFLSFTLYKTERSYKKIIFFYFIGSMVKIVCFYFPYIKDDRLKKN